MPAPVWINTAVAEFGRRMGFSTLALNERGAAALRFENGIGLRLEYARESLFVSVTAPCAADDATLKKLLVTAHPRNHLGVPLRVGRLAKTGEALFLVQLPERNVTDNALETIFSGLWSLATDFRSE